MFADLNRLLEKKINVTKNNMGSTQGFRGENVGGINRIVIN